MPRRGEYSIRDSGFRNVRSNTRRYGVMFNPASSRSRLHIVDSGRRYEVRLTDAGKVEYCLDGVSWRLITPHVDRSSETGSPSFISYYTRRAGLEQKDVCFDMIAVGRGRILAKEKGTDRLFHLVMDELFRTHATLEREGQRFPGFDAALSGDPAVPGAYWKLDPEFFALDDPGDPVPPELTYNYARHPASMRFALFREVLQRRLIDGMVVLQRQRVWYEVDPRSPLAVIGPDDVRVREERLKQLATRTRIEAVLVAMYEQVKSDVKNLLDDSVEDLFGAYWSSAKEGRLGDAIADSIHTSIRQAARDVLGMSSDDARELANAVRFLIGSLYTAMGGLLADRVAEWLLTDLTEWLEDELIDRFFGALIAAIAPTIRQHIQEEGFGALVLPAWFGVLWAMYHLRRGASGERAIDTVVPGDQSTLAFHPSRVLSRLREAFPENEALNDLVNRLMRDARGTATPNPPPPAVPSYDHVTYTRRDGGDTEIRQSIDFSEVLDIGVGYSHWTEHWHEGFGGEIHMLLARRPITQQEQYLLTQFRFLNGPIIDGDGFNDGTCNFYMLVKLADNEKVSRKRGDGGAVSEYGIVWIDEQTYFSQRWRLLHPTADVRGDWTSIARTFNDNPEFYRFSPESFWSPFAEGLIDGNSRMVVRRQVIAVTGMNSRQKTPEIYTICRSYGVSDHTWRWRLFPEGVGLTRLGSSLAGGPPDELPNANAREKPVAFVDTIDLRDDLTLTVRGLCLNSSTGSLSEARWFQQYLPADFRHRPRAEKLEPGRRPRDGFDHGWHCVSETAYRRADRFYQLGVYEERIDARCQYYEVELSPNENGVIPAVSDIVGKVWRNDAEHDANPLYINTVNVDWSLPKQGGYIPFRSLTEDRRLANTMSMYEPTTRFRIQERIPNGLIAVFYDKRDDELQSASHLPQEVTLREDRVEDSIPSHWDDEEPTEGRSKLVHTPVAKRAQILLNGEAGKRPPKPHDIRVLFRRNHRVSRPPMVKKAVVNRVLNAGALIALDISFWTPQMPEAVYENIWKMSLAGLVDTGVILLAERHIYADFVRAGLPDHPLPLDYKDSDLTDEYRYDYHWSDFDEVTRRHIDTLCTPEGRFNYATNLWFENVVGHRATPERLTFDVVSA